MRPELDLLEQIDLYLEGKLSGEDLINFEEKIANDSELKSQVESVRNCNNLILNLKLQELRDQIQNDIKTIPHNPYKWMNLLWLCIPLATVLFYSYTNNNKSNFDSKSESKIQKISNNENNLSYNFEINKKSSSKLNQKNTSIDLSNYVQLNPSLETPNIVANPKEDIANKITFNDVINKVENLDVKNETNQLNPCSTIVIDSKVFVSHSCNNQNTGQIKFANINGGQSPYVYSIKFNQEFVSEENFEKLEPGEYIPKIMDSHGCIKELDKVIINAFHCDKNQADYAFNPLYNESFIFPTNNGVIKIFARDGNLIYTANIKDVKEWDGQMNQGGVASTGTYLYIIEIENDNQVKGYVTIY